MTAYLAPQPKLQFFLPTTSQVASGALLFTYAAGTTTKTATYTDFTGSVPNTNPIVLDASGECSLYFAAGQAYKITFAPANDTDPPSNPYWTVDNIAGVNDEYAVSATAYADTFSGNGTQTAFTLTAAPGSQASLDVSISGVTQVPGIDYTWLSGTTVIFTSAPPNGTRVLIRYSQTLPTSNFDAGTISFSNSAIYGINTVGNSLQSALTALIKTNLQTQYSNTIQTIGANTAVIQNQYHPNWIVAQTQAQDNPTEWQVYSSSSGGIVTLSGSNTVTWNSGAQFESYWTGLPIYINGLIYTVASVTSNTSLTVSSATQTNNLYSGSIPVIAGTFPYYFSTTSTNGTCNVSGTSVTWASGQGFIPYPTTININGTPYSYTFNNSKSLTLGTSAGNLTGVTFTQYCNINDELSVLRLQSTAYLDQENFCITQTANGTILETQYGGGGKYRPIRIRTGEQPAGSQQVMVALYPNLTLGQPGTLLLGGDFNREVLNIPCNTSNVNYFYVQGGPTGFGPSIAQRGTDVAPGMGFDVQANGTTTFTSHSFGSVEFQVFGVGGSSWLAAQSSSTAAPILSANGSATNIDIELLPKGTGSVWIGNYTSGAPTAGGYITVKDSAGVVRKLLCV